MKTVAIGSQDATQFNDILVKLSFILMYMTYDISAARGTEFPRLLTFIGRVQK